MKHDLPKKKTGSARMKEQGYHQVQLWLDRAEYSLVRMAADAAGMPLATWVRKLAFQTAADWKANVRDAAAPREPQGETFYDALDDK